MSSRGGHIRLSRTNCLDYCFTLIMKVLEAGAKKELSISEKLAGELLHRIVKKEKGPIAFACFKALFEHPGLLLEALHYIEIGGEGSKPSFSSMPTSQLQSVPFELDKASLERAIELADPKVASSLLSLIMDTKPPSK